MEGCPIVCSMASLIRVASLLHGIEISQRKGIRIYRKDRKDANDSVLSRMRHNDDGSNSELPASFNVNSRVGLGVIAPLRHLPADGHSGEARLTIDRVSDLGNGQSSYGATESLRRRVSAQSQRWWRPFPAGHARPGCSRMRSSFSAGARAAVTADICERSGSAHGRGTLDSRFGTA